jgi:hypothetical protein
MSETTVENCDNSIHPHKDPPTEPSKQTKGKSKKAQTFDQKINRDKLTAHHSRHCGASPIS